MAADKKKKKVPQFKGRIREGSMLDLLGGQSKKAGEAKVVNTTATEQAKDLARSGLAIKVKRKK